MKKIQNMSAKWLSLCEKAAHLSRMATSVRNTLCAKYPGEGTCKYHDALDRCPIRRESDSWFCPACPSGDICLSCPHAPKKVTEAVKVADAAWSEVIVAAERGHEVMP